MIRRYFEFVEGTSSKFWEVWIEGSEVRTRYGRIGASGQTTVKDQGSPDAATKLHDALVAEKTRKGYIEKTAGVAPAAPAAPATPATDVHDAQITRIEAKAKAAGVKLARGASDAAIAALEQRIGQALPDEARAFYRRHDGAAEDAAVEGRELLSLERIAAEWDIWKELLDGGEFEANDHGAPDPGVQQKWWIPEWVPISHDGAGNHHVLDLAPAPGGTRGQVLAFWHDDAPRTVVAPGFLAWLESASWGAVEDAGDDGEAEAAAPASTGDFRRFEMEEKFWSIRLDGSAFTVRFGKQGTAGQEKTKDLGNAAAAKLEYDKLIAEKTKKGYQEV